MEVDVAWPVIGYPCEAIAVHPRRIVVDDWMVMVPARDLDGDEPVTRKTIHRITGVDPGAINSTVARLEREGNIEIDEVGAITVTDGARILMQRGLVMGGKQQVPFTAWQCGVTGAWVVDDAIKDLALAKSGLHSLTRGKQPSLTSLEDALRGSASRVPSLDKEDIIERIAKGKGMTKAVATTLRFDVSGLVPLLAEIPPVARHFPVEARVALNAMVRSDDLPGFDDARASARKASKARSIERVLEAILPGPIEVASRDWTEVHVLDTVRGLARKGAGYALVEDVALAMASGDLPDDLVDRAVLEAMYRVRTIARASDSLVIRWAITGDSISHVVYEARNEKALVASGTIGIPGYVPPEDDLVEKPEPGKARNHAANDRVVDLVERALITGGLACVLVLSVLVILGTSIIPFFDALAWSIVAWGVVAGVHVLVMEATRRSKGLGGKPFKGARARRV